MKVKWCAAATLMWLMATVGQIMLSQLYYLLASSPHRNETLDRAVHQLQRENHMVDKAFLETESRVKYLVRPPDQLQAEELKRVLLRVAGQDTTGQGNVRQDGARWEDRAKRDKAERNDTQQKEGVDIGHVMQYPSSLHQEEGSSVTHRLRHLLTQTTTTCRKMVRMGGRSCLGAYDGSKMVCLDAGLGINPCRCLVYSFGVGHDFTFDEHMQDLGCEVHSFDHDTDHEIYDYRLGPTAFFHKARVGFKTGNFRYCDDEVDRPGCDSPIRYQTLADIRRSLGHERQRVDYLKLDIEGGEWGVLEQVLHHHPSRTFLAAASHISLEIHLDAVRHKKTPEARQTLLTSYLNTLQNLTSLGFQLVSNEVNELNPQFDEINGVQLSLYAEILLINRNFLHFVPN